jgi:hypothetical protein
MGLLLDLLRVWPLPDEQIGRLRQLPEWSQARRWGWIMESGELTGSGWAHANGDRPKGILPRSD